MRGLSLLLVRVVLVTMEEMLGHLSSFSIMEEEAKVIGISDEVMEKDRREKEQDRMKVLVMEPWTFNKSLLILKSMNGVIWEIGEKIRKWIGKFIDVVTDKNGHCPGIYMRLRVQIDVSKPLRLECVDAKVRNMKAYDQLLYSPKLRANTRSLGPGKVGCDRRDGSGGRREHSRDPNLSALDFLRSSIGIHIFSKVRAKDRDPRFKQISNPRDLHLHATTNEVTLGRLTKKKKTWRQARELLKRLRTNPEVPWICGGDFNKILTPTEAEGGGDCSLNDMLLFRETLDWYDLVDMDYVGPKLTWDNWRIGSANIQVRLDRFVANTCWRLKFRRAKVAVLDFWGSDHRALLLQLVPNKKNDNKRRYGDF
ncbi:hypothetical protein TIFTF001_006730 [Ficus carica]|uniref:Endonuclease/exonuclease/phosphatase domain-containing protein n=1 Tax=Ficus carica TaxID=3494 RepID=A0AA87ZRT8_FICCA|nr:hypothetical protein TIFTF001_006730 [Ficus carica]